MKAGPVLCCDNSELFLWALPGGICLECLETLSSGLSYMLPSPWRHWPSAPWVSADAYEFQRHCQCWEWDSREQTSLDDRSAFSLSEFWQLLWPWQPQGAQGHVVVSLVCKSSCRGRGEWDFQDPAHNTSIPLLVDQEIPWAATLHVSSVSQPLSCLLAPFHKQILNLIITANITLSFQVTEVWYPRGRLQINYSWKLLWQLRLKGDYNGWFWSFIFVDRVLTSRNVYQ